MDRELLVAHSGGKLLPKRVLFLETKEHPQISNASFWKRDGENVSLRTEETVKTFHLGLSLRTEEPTYMLPQTLTERVV